MIEQYSDRGVGSVLDLGDEFFECNIDQTAEVGVTDSCPLFHYFQHL
jgi:hypothetical protein